MASENSTQAPRQARSNNVVWVECKLPNGLWIYLEREGVNDTGKKVFLPINDTRVRLNGANASRVVGGYGLTEVDADFWEAWYAKHKHDSYCASGAVKAQPTRDRAMAQAVDEAKLRTGFEPLDPDKPGPGLERVPEKELKAAAAMGGA